MKLLHKSSLIAILVVLAATCEHAASHVIEFHHKYYQARRLVKVECVGGATIVGRGPRSFLCPGESIKITIPRRLRTGLGSVSGSGPGSRKVGCTGQLSDGFNDLIKFNVYSVHRDRERCRNECKIEARDSGLYGKSVATDLWDYIAPYRARLS